jgi:L-aspartate oxidase
MDRTMVVNLIVRNGQCYGVYALDENGSPVVIRAKATIMTTGGASQLFAKNLYPADITGDGYAMAHRAGAYLVNMEFMQAGVSIVSPFINLFGNYLWDARPNLTDRDGKVFVPDYLPDGTTLDSVIRQKERHFPFSSRDISRYIEISIQKAINEGRGTDEGGVYMDFIDTDFDEVLADETRSIAKMWSTTYEWYKARGADLYRDKVQIACSAHAVNGGIYIDDDAQSNIKGLFAAGEVAAGPHGADRLGGNMSVTCQVFGRRAGRAAAARARNIEHPRFNDIYEEQHAFMSQFRGRGEESLPELRKRLQREANRYLLVVREEDGLQRFAETCREMHEALRSATVIETPEDVVHALELNNLCEVGSLMTMAALERRESRGGHYREDFPYQGETQGTNIFLHAAKPDGFFRARFADLRQEIA